MQLIATHVLRTSYWKARATKIKIRGSRLPSPFELLYAIQLRITDKVGSLVPPPASVSTQESCSANDHVNLMLQKPPHLSRITNLVLPVPAYFWRDDKECLGPANISDVTEHHVILAHNAHKKLSSISQVKQILPDTTNSPDSVDDTTAPPCLSAAHTVSQTIAPTQLLPPPQCPMSSKEVRSLQANANRIVDSLPIPQALDLAIFPCSTPMGHTYN